MTRSCRPSASLTCQRGITLLEVVISSAIFAVGVLGMTRMYVVASTSDGQARRLDEATAIAYDLLGYLQAVPLEEAPFLVPRGNAYDDLLDEAPGSMVFRGDDAPEPTDYDYDCGELPAPGDDDEGEIRAPFVGLSSADPNSPPMDARYERYWRLQWLDVHADDSSGQVIGQALGIAVIVRWPEPFSRGHKRVVVFGTRYDPQDILP